MIGLALLVITSVIAYLAGRRTRRSEAETMALIVGDLEEAQAKQAKRSAEIVTSRAEIEASYDRLTESAEVTNREVDELRRRLETAKRALK